MHTIASSFTVIAKECRINGLCNFSFSLSQIIYSTTTSAIPNTALADQAKQEEPQRPKSKTHQFHYKLISVNYIPNTASADPASHEKPQDVVTLSRTLSHNTADTLLHILLLHRLRSRGPNQPGLQNYGLKQPVSETTKVRATDQILFLHSVILNCLCWRPMSEPLLQILFLCSVILDWNSLCLRPSEPDTTTSNYLSTQHNPGMNSRYSRPRSETVTQILSSQCNLGIKQHVFETIKVRATTSNSLSSQHNCGLKQPDLDHQGQTPLPQFLFFSQHNCGLKQPDLDHQGKSHYLKFSFTTV